MPNLLNEVFALRPGEVIYGQSERPTEGKWIAVMLRTVDMPEGERHPTRPLDNKPVEQCGVSACAIVDGKWQWLALSPPTKEVVGDYFFDGNWPRNEWLYLVVK